MDLDTSVSALPTVGSALLSKLKRIGIEEVKDLLFYFPFRYEDFSQTVAIQDLQDGQQVTVKAVIELIANKRGYRKRRMITEALVSDDTGQLRVVWWGQPFITKNLKAGDTVFFSGKVSNDTYGVVMKSPSYEKEKSSSAKGTHTGRIVPMYPLTAGVTQKQLRFLMSKVIHLSDQLEDWLPKDIQEEVDVMPYGEAVRSIHFPEDNDEITHAENRLKFDELFVLQLRAEMLRQALKRHNAPSIPFKEKEVKTFVESLPFTLTKAQKVAAWDIFKDVQREDPMNRLLEGDVGSGKTIVAGLIMYNAALSSFQSIIMAPTEILVAQHFESLKKLPGENLRIGIYSRTQVDVHNAELKEKTKAGRKREIISLMKEGKLDVVVGTHSLLSDEIEFNNLGIVIVDEQHRFGVHQRKIIREKSGNPDTHPHFLSMTATPIPRSFALTLYGDLDLSIINEMPKGRKPVKTRLVEPKHRQKAYHFIKEQIKMGRQVFVICPMIDAGVGAEKKSVMQEYEKLDKTIFPDLNIGFLHGKMKAGDKDKAMKDFSDGKTNILVSTSVVEVGVNIPNASVMMIEGAERFGLAQLHQFRGRVGRSSHQSFCFLFTDSDSASVHERLGFFQDNTDGFKVAEYDLSMRGPGEVYGTTQSGMMQFRFATLQDAALIKTARELAKDIDFKKYPSLKDKVKQWEKEVHLE